MTGDQLKRWRTNRRLSQDQLATYLGWTRQKLANVELDRTTMPDDLTAALAAIDATLGRLQPAASPPKPKEPKKCWDVYGREIGMDYVLQQPMGFTFYRLDHVGNRAENGELLANCYQTTRAKPQGASTYFQLNLVTWEVRCAGWQDNPANAAALPKLNAAMAARRKSGQPAFQVQP